MSIALIAELRRKASASYYNIKQAPNHPQSPFGPTGSDPRAVQARELKKQAYELEKLLYQDAKVAFEERRARLTKEWCADLRNAFGVTDHPKCQDIVDRAEEAASADSWGEGTNHLAIIDEMESIMELMS